MTWSPTQLSPIHQGLAGGMGQQGFAGGAGTMGAPWADPTTVLRSLLWPQVFGLLQTQPPHVPGYFGPPQGYYGAPINPFVAQSVPGMFGAPYGPFPILPQVLPQIAQSYWPQVFSLLSGQPQIQQSPFAAQPQSSPFQGGWPVNSGYYGGQYGAQQPGMLQGQPYAGQLGTSGAAYSQMPRPWA